METTHSNTNRRPSLITAGDGAGKVDLPNPVTGIIGRCRRSALGLLFLCAFTTVSAAAELSLTPTEVMLVDGRKVQGQLVCKLANHLVLYSPGLGIMQSFRKEFVASYTDQAKKPVKLSAPKALSPDELQKLDWNGWPDAAPATGPKPAYSTEKWGPPRRLIVWKEPGKSGSITDPANWLVLGEALPANAFWDAETDMLLPSSDAEYRVVGGNGGHNAGDRITTVLRHSAVENGARFSSSDGDFFGNDWIHRRGSNGMRFAHNWKGGKHTFARTDYPTLYKPGVIPSDIPEKQRIYDTVGQYLNVIKEASGSVEFLGVIASNDKFYIQKGVAIAGPGSQCMSADRNSDHIYKGATLHILDGAIWGKRTGFVVNNSMTIEGTLTGGMPGRELTQDATIILSVKDYTGLMGGGDVGLDAAGIRVEKSGAMRIYSSDPAKARLIIRHSNNEHAPSMMGLNVNPSIQGQNRPRFDKAAHLIDVVFLGDVVLDGVLFEDVFKGGVRLANLGMKDTWKHVTFGPHCGSTKPEEMFAVYQKNTPPIGWLEDPVVKEALKK